MKKQKDGRYRIRVFLGCDESGKKQYKSVYGSTVKEVKEKEAEIRQKIAKGCTVISSLVTWGDWVDAWIEYKANLVTENQLAAYKSNIEHFDELRNYELLKLNYGDFQRIIDRLAKRNPHTGKPTARKSLKEFKMSAGQVFKYAIKNRVTEYNAAQYIEIPNAAAAPKHRRALTNEEQALIINTPHRAQLPAMIMLLSGLRLGECLALQWCDIDLGNATINVHQVLRTKSGKAVIEQGAKTDNSIRTVDIPQTLVNFLKVQPSHTPCDYVVTTAKGALMNKSAWRRLWESYMTDLNIVVYNSGKSGVIDIERKRSKYDPNGVPQIIQPFTAHYLRHTHATNLFYAGYDVLYVQHQLGHSKPETTMNIYTHFVAEKKKTNVSKLDSYLAQNVS